MLSSLAENMARYFYLNQIIEKDDIEIYKYGAELLLATVFEMLAVLFISIFLGKILLTLLFLFSFCMLRQYAGGFHASSHFRCFLTLLFVYSLFVAMVFSLQKIQIQGLPLVFSFLSELIILKFAPVDNENKRLSEQEKRKYRKISIIVVSAETFFVLLLFLTNFNYFFIFAISYGEMAAALSLVADKITKLKGRNQNESNKSICR